MLLELIEVGLLLSESCRPPLPLPINLRLFWVASFSIISIRFWSYTSVPSLFSHFITRGCLNTAQQYFLVVLRHKFTRWVYWLNLVSTNERQDKFWLDHSLTNLKSESSTFLNPNTLHTFLTFYGDFRSAIFWVFLYFFGGNIRIRHLQMWDCYVVAAFDRKVL